MSIEEIKLGYVVTSSTSKGYIGAILITDYKGYPLEFQYTDPIAPTKVQQVLYGSGLEKYIKVDVIMDSLIKVISSRIDLFIVQDEELLNYKTSLADIVRVSVAKKAQVVEGQDLTKIKGSEYVLNIKSAGGPIRLQFANAISEEDEKFQKIVDSIKETSSFIDVYEPLDRVYKSIELITKQEV